MDATIPAQSSPAAAAALSTSELQRPKAERCHARQPASNPPDISPVPPVCHDACPPPTTHRPPPADACPRALAPPRSRPGPKRETEGESRG
ncbi:hypothetical protein AK830_g2982 [Neonectria ditissima]|uniref:Uncharacterized protein n=1 Tax=Neonectria ditissima TaxID=78410 RepID=A0A0P7BT36_9HYPO|nr:hypothetical protein AK830_g2982 [Neonectria ditissima]